jgi:anaerobic selenocysteine-containing dehydrogenase
MSEVSRRSFIKRSAAGVAGAAAIGALGTGPASAASRLASHTGADADAVATSDDAVVAYVRPGTREVRVMKGEQEVVHRDADLVRRLLRAAK